MTTFTHATGNSGTMRIDDDGTDYVDFYLLGVNELVDQVPWAYTLNGETVSWRSFRLEADLAWHKLASLWVGTTQTVTFKLGASGNIHLGGPTDFSLDVKRTDPTSTGSGDGRIKVGDAYSHAIPYINDKGVWKQAEPWGRIAGLWKPAN